MQQPVHDSDPPANQAPAPLAPPQAAQKPEGALSKFIRFIAFPVSAATGYMVTRLEVRDAANRQAIQDGTFKDIVDDARNRAKPFVEARIRGEISEEEFMARDTAIRTEYRNAADARMKHMGRRGFIEKFNYLSRSNARKTVLDGMTVAGITLGVMLTLSDTQLLANLASSDKGASKEL